MLYKFESTMCLNIGAAGNGEDCSEYHVQ